MFHHGKVINQKNQARGDPTQEREKGIPTITKILMGYDCHKAGPKDFRRDFLFFLVGSRVPLWIAVQQLVVILVLSHEEMSTCPTLPS